MNKKAVIFDMDGVLIDSEPLWQQAQIGCLSEYSVTVTADDCINHTMGKRIDAIAQTWCDLHHLDVAPKMIEQQIVSRLCQLIVDHGEAMPGVNELLTHLQHHGYRIGLATSSSYEQVDTVMHKLGIAKYFSVICSGDDEQYGKPHPAVYLTAAAKLGVAPKDCVVIEDSLNGLIAARAATITTFLVSQSCQQSKFAFADQQLTSLFDVIPLL